jgi:hypothetical protein
MKLKYILAIAALALLSLPEVQAQSNPNCICNNGCKIASDPFPPPAAVQPVTCTVLKSGVAIATGPVVASTTIPNGNGTVCQPSSAPYAPGVAGSVACLVTIPAQPVGTVTLVMTATNAAGTTAASAPFAFVSVAALSTLPPVPVIHGVAP